MHMTVSLVCLGGQMAIGSMMLAHVPRGTRISARQWLVFAGASGVLALLFGAALSVPSAIGGMALMLVSDVLVAIGAFRAFRLVWWNEQHR